MITDVTRTLDDGLRARLANLWVAAWTAAMPTIDFEARRRWFDDALTALVDTGALLILRRHDPGAIVGFLTLDPASGDIEQLAVDPHHQRHGHAAALLGEARQLSPSRLSLRVNRDNATAVRFYRREGFRVTGCGVNERSGRPVWLMAWAPGSQD